MHRLLTRLIAVMALALAPLVGVGSVSAQSEHWPVYPSLYYSYSSCNVANNYVVCQPGGLMESQINSGYQCNEIDVVMTTYNAGPVDITMSANDQSVTQTMTIDGDGTYYTQFPGYLVNNLVALEFSMPDGASFGLPTIYSAPCPVATSTPTAAPSNTPNPSDTPTATVNPSYTVTPIPTHTPLPSGHSTFTATPTSTPTIATATPVTGNCGGPDFPLLNCPWYGAGVGASYAPGTYWSRSYSSGNCAYNTSTAGLAYANTSYAMDDPPYSGQTDLCFQSVTPGATGTLYVQYRVSGDIGTTNISLVKFCLTSGCGPNLPSYTACPVTGSVDCVIAVGSVASGGTTDFSVRMAPVSPGATGLYLALDIDRVWVGTTADTPTAAPTSTSTITVEPTNTPLPNPFGSSTPVPSDTECPGGCAVTELTQVPGVQTQITVDTSPFSPLLHLSLARSPCTPFGYVQIPYPVITGTPALGQPLNFGWTAPITHTWDDTHLITNTAIQPCAMVGEISPYVWDFTYWGSGVGLAIVFTLWLIGWVGRLSGDHTIDG